MPSDHPLLTAVSCAVADMVPHERLSVKQLSTYTAIVLDGDSRKTLCRLYIHKAPLRIGIIDIRKIECLHTISNVTEIDNYAEDLKTTLRKYLGI